LEQPPALPQVPPLDRRELLRMEREMLGLYVTDHPVRTWEAVLRDHVRHRVADLQELEDRTQVSVGGVLTHVRPMVSKKDGSRFAVASLEDLSGAVEVVVWPKTYERCGEALHVDAVVVVRGRVDAPEGRARLVADEVVPVESLAGGSNGPAKNGPRPLHVRVTTSEELYQLADFLQGPVRAPGGLRARGHPPGRVRPPPPQGRPLGPQLRPRAGDAPGRRGRCGRSRVPRYVYIERLAGYNSKEVAGGGGEFGQAGRPPTARGGPGCAPRRGRHGGEPSVVRNGRPGAHIQRPLAGRVGQVLLYRDDEPHLEVGGAESALGL
jgi:hypothetical protein